MAASFPRTLAALRADRGRGALIAGAVGLAILAAWLTWMFAARVAVYRRAGARLEVSPAPARVAAPVGGRITAVELTVGASVAAGAVLLELDATAEQIALARAQAQLAALEPEVASVARELAAEDAASGSGATADRVAVRGAAARQRAADVAVALAEEEEGRVRALVDAAAASPAELSRASADVRQKRAARDALAHEGEARDAERLANQASRRARREQLERQRTELDAALAAARGELDRLGYELARRIVRAPVAGVLGEVAPVRPGAVIAAGDVIATVVPGGRLQVIADYGADAIGRLAPGQRAQVRLDGFPWTHHGTVAAQVARVGSELRDGAIRVELALTDAAPRLPLRHGMTGTVEIEVERVSPATLLLRAAGDRIDDAGRP